MSSMPTSLIVKLTEGFMRDFGCSIKRITSVLIRPGSVVRVHHGPLSISASFLCYQHCR